MIEGGCRLGLAHETPDSVFALDQLRREDLERYVSLERLILREVHLPHAAGTEGTDNPVMGNLILGLKRAGRRHEGWILPGAPAGLGGISLSREARRPQARAPLPPLRRR